MPKLVKNGVFKTLINMAVPMLAATFAMNAYNLTDTWFVSRLGTDALAAMSFTFPVVMLLRFVFRGVGSGAMTTVAHALGEKNQHAAATLTTHALLLMLLVSSIMSMIGLASIRFLFMHLGAMGHILNLTEQYMTIWFFGLVVMSLQMIILDIIIGTGSSKMTSVLVASGTILNFILDPLFIFGLFGFPKMGIRGAALATILAQLVTLIASGYLLHKKYHLISFPPWPLSHVFASWKHILHFGIPGVFSSILTPISAAIIIRIVADFGPHAVAACGVATRIEMFAFMIPMTVGVSLLPFVAQNYGARRFDRIESARKGTITFALSYGLAAAVLFLFMARPFARIFSNNPDVIAIITQYIHITCFGYGFLEIHRYAGFYMIGIHAPLSANILNVIRVLVLLIPLSLIGANAFGLLGIFGGRLLTDLSTGVIGIIWSRKVLTRTIKRAEIPLQNHAQD